MAQKILGKQVKLNTARFNTYQGSNQATTSTTYVDFTPSVSITTTGGALEVFGHFVGYVNTSTAFMAIQVNGVDYEFATLSNTTEAGYAGFIITPALPAGTYTVRLRGKIGGGTLTLLAYRSQTLYAKEVAV